MEIKMVSLNAITQKKLLASAILLALSTQAAANDTDKDKKDSKEMEEVAVVGQKISYANNTVDASMMEQQAPLTSVIGLMDTLPGISINEGDAFGGDDWSTTINMRGFAIDGSQQQLGMTVDGIPNGGSNYGGGAKANRYLDSENTLTVEVSQGTANLASASLDALGGTFNFVSKMPELEEKTTIAYTNGDHNARRYFARHETGEIFDNTFAYISYSDTSTNRWVGDGNNGGMANQHIEMKFISEIGNINLTGRISYDDVEEDNYNSVSIEQFKQSPDWDQLTWNWTGVPHYDQMFAEGWSTLRENTLAYLKFDYTISNTSSFDVTPYFHKNKGRGDWIPPYLQAPVDANGNPTTEGGSSAYSYGFTDANGTPLTPNADCTASLSWPWASGPGLNPACYPADALPVMSYRHTHYEKERFGFTSNYMATFDNHDISAGIWVETAKRDESRDWHEVINAAVYHHFDQTPYWVQYKNTFDTDTFKWYLQDSINFNDLTVNVGVQQYLVDIEKTAHFDTAANAKVNSDSDVLFSLGGLYQLNESTELFASYSENFSAISDNVLERDASTLTSIDPETADNIDFGVRYFGEKLDISATVYSIEFDNRITFLAPNSGNSGIDYGIGTNGSYINVGGIESQGIEVSAKYKISDSWELYSSFTNNQSEYTDTVESEGITKGDNVRDAVEDMFVLSANYFTGNLTFGASSKYTGERGVADSYVVTDINMAYHVDLADGPFQSFNVALVVGNVFDKQYLSSGTGSGTTFYIGAPRTATMTFQVDF